MRVAWIFLGLGPSLACAPIAEGDGQAVAAAPSESATSEPVPESAPEPKPKPKPKAAPLAWRWVEQPGETPDSAGHDLHTVDNIRYQFTVSADRHHATVMRTGSKGREDWRRELPEVFVTGGFLALGAQHLFVAHHSLISSGATVLAFELETGAPVWTTTLQALGPVDHSKYSNHVQLQVRDGAVIAYGSEAQGRYVETLDETTGALRGHVVVDPALAEIEWTWDGRTGTTRDGEATLSIVDGGVTYRLVYSPIASGGQLAALGGDTPWRTPLEALGPIAHSRYGNEATVRLLGDDIIVFGRESAGRYLEVRDRASGALRSSHVVYSAR